MDSKQMEIPISLDEDPRIKILRVKSKEKKPHRSRELRTQTPKGATKEFAEVEEAEEVCLS